MARLSTSNRDYPAAANTAAVVTYAAVPGKAHSFTGLKWSYNDDPTGGRLTVENGAGVYVVDLDITTGGPGFIPFEDGDAIGNDGTAMIITLAAGGASVKGKITVTGYRLLNIPN